MRLCSILLAFAFSLHSMSAVLVKVNRPANNSEPQTLRTETDEQGARSNTIDTDTYAEGGGLPNSNFGYILLQFSNSNAVCNGEKIKLMSGSGLSLTPFYEDNQAMIPLRLIAEMLDYSVAWDASSKTIHVKGAGVDALLTVGCSYASCNGQTIMLNTPVVMQGDSAYAPARSVCQMLGVYIHYYDKSDGEFLLITNSPISSGDLAGDINEDFNNSAPDANLLGLKSLGLEVLGPSLSMFSHRTLFLRCGSTYSVFKGKDAVITDPGAGAAAPVKTADGHIFVPLVYCAACFDVKAERMFNGELSVSAGGKTSVFPLGSGYFIQDGEVKEDIHYATMEFDGVVYTTVEAIAAALGVYYTNYDEETLMLSAYDVRSYDNLQSYAGAQIPRLRQLPEIKGYLALTFDDGPSGDVTARLLNGLKERNVRATFFLCNYRIAQYPELMPRYESEGHEVGNHSASHSDLTTLSVEAIGNEIDQTSETIAGYTGVSPCLLRPPCGAYNKTLLGELGRRSMSCVLWSVDPKDWLDHNSRSVTNKIVSAAKDGDIILLHDMSDSSVDAGLAVIDILQEKGYKFLTVSDLALIKGYVLNAGEVYRKFP
jgi:peptidoglycan/xylan/chitin deacetylase (PgdA/CDA1 family)